MFENGYPSPSTYSGAVVRIAWSSSYKRWTRTLTPTLWQRPCDDHAKFTPCEKHGSGRWETAWKCTVRAVGSVFCQGPNANLPSPLTFSKINHKPGRSVSDCAVEPLCLVARVALCCEPLLSVVVIVARYFVCLLCVCFPPIWVKHRGGFQSPKTCLFILRVNFDNEMNFSI